MSTYAAARIPPSHPRLSAAVGAALDCLDAAARTRHSYSRHAVWERLAMPDRYGCFAVPWMDDRGRVRVHHGYYALPPRSREGIALFRGGLCEDELLTLLFLRRLQGALTDRPGTYICGLDADPAALSDGESMRLCRGFLDGLRRVGLRPETLRADGVPARERGYLPEDADRPFGNAAALSREEAAGQGLCFFAWEVLRAVAGERPENTTIALTGYGETADAAAETAVRLGFRVVSAGAASEVVFLCDPITPLTAADAAILLRRGVKAVFEGVPAACSPAAAARLRENGVLLAPAIAAGAGGSVPRTEGSAWDAARRLRHEMRRLLETARQAGAGDLYRGAYAAALTKAADDLVRRGV